MASLENHRRIAYEVLLEYKFSTDIANTVAYYTSIYADNPGEYGLLKEGDSAVYGTKANNIGHFNIKDDGLSYNCLMPRVREYLVFGMCKAPVKINHSATINSQKDLLDEVKRHGMSTSEEYKNEVEQVTERVNRTYENQLSEFGLSSLKNYPKLRFLNPAQFKRPSTLSGYNTVFESAINAKLTALRSSAVKRGLEYGWENVFQAIGIGKIDDIKLDKSNPELYTINDTGTSILSKLGVGIHALQDSKVHGGESMYEYKRYWLLSQGFHGYHDVRLDKEIEKSMREITKGAIMIFCIMKDNSRLSKLDYDFLEKNINDWNLPSQYQNDVNNKITNLKFEKNFQPVKSDSTTKSYA